MLKPSEVNTARGWIPDCFEDDQGAQCAAVFLVLCAQQPGFDDYWPVIVTSTQLAGVVMQIKADAAANPGHWSHNPFASPDFGALVKQGHVTMAEGNDAMTIHPSFIQELARSNAAYKYIGGVDPDEGVKDMHAETPRWKSVAAGLLQLLDDIEALKPPETDTPFNRALHKTLQARFKVTGRWKSIAARLWQLLDDIDTLTDMCKAPEPGTAFSNALHKTLQARFGFMTSDGHRLFWPEDEPPAGKPRVTMDQPCVVLDIDTASPDGTPSYTAAIEDLGLAGIQDRQQQAIEDAAKDPG